jgi:hypothetical protein
MLYKTAPLSSTTTTSPPESQEAEFNESKSQGWVFSLLGKIF